MSGRMKRALRKLRAVIRQEPPPTRRIFHRFSCVSCSKEPPHWWDDSSGWRCVRCDPPRETAP